jgi:outer membrane protein assembly factor BamB
MRCMAVCLLASMAWAQSSDRFELLAKYRALGGLSATAVGPGSAPGSERVYASYLYVFNTIDVVAIDPATGESRVYANPAPGESGARCIVTGADGNIYLGTLMKAHFLKLDTKAGRLIDLGRPSSTEEYIWDVTFGADGRLYGATYPQSKLVRYDPKTGALEDLGRMDANELYAHSVAGSDDGFMYVGIGTSRANIAAYEIATGLHREILPESAQVLGQAKVWRGEDGKVYGSIGERTFRLQSWTATELRDPKAATAAPSPHLRDGRRVEIVGRTLKIIDPKTHATDEKQFAYAGNELPLFRIGFGPDGGLYGSSILPIHMVKLDAAAHELRELGDVGGGEIYAFLARKDRLLMAGYGSLAPLMSYDPAAPFSLDPAHGNPATTNFPNADGGWRPQAMINGTDGNVYLGSVAGYGKLGGPLTSWNVESGKVEQFHHLVADQSVVSLTAWGERLVGGTTVIGGGGSHPTQTEARIFIWNPRTKQKEFEAIAVPGAKSITGLVAAANGRVYGIADETMFTFDPKTRQTVPHQKVKLGEWIYNSMGVGPDGRIWGLSGDGIFAIDPKTDTLSMVAKSPSPITAGFAIRDGAIYFVCGSTVYRYLM